MSSRSNSKSPKVNNVNKSSSSSKAPKERRGLTGADFKANDIRKQVYEKSELFLGSLEIESSFRYLFDIESDQITEDMILTSEGFERIVLEIMYNASDNVIRSRKFGVDPKEIEMAIDENGYFTFTNYGTSLPVELMKDANGNDMYVITGVFGRVFAGSNLDKTKTREVSGTYGAGSSLTNIMSNFLEAYVEDADRHLSAYQYWTDNASFESDVVIKEFNGDESKVVVRFLPDYKRFGMEGLTQQLFMVFCAYMIFISYTMKIPVILNGKRYEQYSDINQFAALFTSSELEPIIHHEYPVEVIQKILNRELEPNTMMADLKVADRKKVQSKVKDWKYSVEIHASFVERDPKVISFTNGIFNIYGGVHVNKVYNELGKLILPEINKKVIAKLTKENGGKKPSALVLKRETITMDDLRKYISLIISVNVKNPLFDSQNKNKLTSPEPNIKFSSEDMKIFNSWPVKDILERELNQKEDKPVKVAKKGDFKFKGVKANYAGKSKDCVLYGAEGASAIGYLNTFIDLLPGGRDYAGTIEFKGKTLNVLKTNLKKIKKNDEIATLLYMTGIDPDVKDKENYYLDEVNFKKLHYSKFVIVTDADNDGYHIKGLIINIFNLLAPSLIKRGYVQSLLTPILRVMIGKVTYKFYTKSQYTTWFEKYENDHNNFNEASRRISILSDRIANKQLDYKDVEEEMSYYESIIQETSYAKTKPQNLVYKYFKGLGTSKDDDVKDDFKTKKTVEYVLDQYAVNYINLAFNKDLSHERKLWVASKSEYDDMTFDAQSEIIQQEISNFINTELIKFSQEDIQRSIPGVIDGQKESQRKILFAALKKWNVNFSNKYTELKVAQFAAYVAEISGYHHGDDSLKGAITKMAQKFIGTNNVPLFSDLGNFGSRLNGGKKPANARYINTTPSELFPYVIRPEDTQFLTYKQDEGEEIEPVTYMPIIPLALVNGADGIATAWSTKIPNYNPIEMCDVFMNILEGKDVEVEMTPWYLGFKGEMRVITKTKPAYNQQGEREDKVERTLISTGIYYIQNERIIITELPYDRNATKYAKELEKLKDDKKIKDYRNLSGNFKVYFEIEGWNNGPISMTSLNLESKTSLNNIVLLDEEGLPVKYETVLDVMYEFFKKRLAFYSVRKAGLLKEIEKDIYKANIKIKLIEAKLNGTLKLDNVEREVVYQQLDEMEIPREVYDAMLASSFDRKGVELHRKNLKKYLDERDRIQNEEEKDTWYRELSEFKEAYIKFMQKKEIQEHNFEKEKSDVVPGSRRRKTAAKK